MSDNITRIDNADGRVIYEGAWIPHFDDKDAWNGTITFTKGVNNSASISFVGNSIAVYGVLSKTEPHTTKYNLDHLPPTAFTPATPPADSASDRETVLFYQSPNLPHGKHALTVTNTNHSSSLWLDYFEVTGDSGNLTAPSSLPSDQLQPAETRTVGAIVGGVLGGLGAALLLLGLILFIMRRRQKGLRGSSLPRYTQISDQGLTQANVNVSGAWLLPPTNTGSGKQL